MVAFTCILGTKAYWDILFENEFYKMLGSRCC